MSARRFLRLTHGWIGAVVGLFVILVAGSGASLAFMSEMFLAQYGDVLRAEAPAPDAPYADLDRIVAAADAAQGNGYSTMGVLMPHSRVPSVETAMAFGMDASGADEPMIVSVDPWTAQAKGSFNLGDALGHEVIDFHYHLLQGDIGATFVAVLGILLVLFALTGLWLWWPRAGGVWRKAKNPHVSGAGKHVWFRLHGWLGVWMAGLIVLFGLTGTAVARDEWFGPLLVQEDAHAPTGGIWARQCGGQVSFGAAAAAAQRLYPDRHVTMIYAGPPGEPYQAMLKGAGDLNAMEGDVAAWVHPTCAGVVHAVDLGEGSAADRAGAMMFSLHGGYTFGNVVGDLLVVSTGLGLVFLTGSGLWVFFTRTLRSGRRQRRITVDEVLQPAE